ncbi:hypothetical protein EJB05_26369, partial [Eragrostis curvula]
GAFHFEAATSAITGHSLRLAPALPPCEQKRPAQTAALLERTARNQNQRRRASKLVSSLMALFSVLGVSPVAAPSSRLPSFSRSSSHGTKDANLLLGCRCRPQITNV